MVGSDWRFSVKFESVLDWHICLHIGQFQCIVGVDHVRLSLIIPKHILAVLIGQSCD